MTELINRLAMALLSGRRSRAGGAAQYKRKAYSDGPSAAEDWLKVNAASLWNGDRECEANLKRSATMQVDERSYLFPDNSLVVYNHEQAGR